MTNSVGALNNSAAHGADFRPWRELCDWLTQDQVDMIESDEASGFPAWVLLHTARDCARENLWARAN